MVDNGYSKWIHRFGIASSLLLLVAMSAFPVAISCVYGIWPDFKALWPGFVAVILFMAPYWPAETIGYMSVKPAFDYVVPALFGGLVAQTVLKGKKQFLYFLAPLAICLFFCYCTAVNSAYYMLIAIAVSVVIYILDYKKEKHKECK